MARLHDVGGRDGDRRNGGCLGRGGRRRAGGLVRQLTEEKAQGIWGLAVRQSTASGLATRSRVRDGDAIVTLR